VTIPRVRTSLAVFLSVFLLGTLSVNCGKDDLKPPVRGKITWTVNGRSYTADYVTSAERRASGSYNDPDVAIMGISYARSTLHIDLNPVSGPGTYGTTEPPLHFHSVRVSVNSLNYEAHNQVDTAVAATIVVTELTADKIKGNFEGTLVGHHDANYEIISVNGSFDVPFSK
jgi:hypothetical protein